MASGNPKPRSLDTSISMPDEADAHHRLPPVSNAKRLCVVILIVVVLKAYVSLLEANHLVNAFSSLSNLWFLALATGGSIGIGVVSAWLAQKWFSPVIAVMVGTAFGGAATLPIVSLLGGCFGTLGALLVVSRHFRRLVRLMSNTGLAVLPVVAAGVAAGFLGHMTYYKDWPKRHLPWLIGIGMFAIVLSLVGNQMVSRWLARKTSKTHNRNLQFAKQFVGVSFCLLLLCVSVWFGIQADLYRRMKAFENYGWIYANPVGWNWQTVLDSPFRTVSLGVSNTCPPDMVWNQLVPFEVQNLFLDNVDLKGADLGVLKHQASLQWLRAGDVTGINNVLQNISPKSLNSFYGDNCDVDDHSLALLSRQSFLTQLEIDRATNVTSDGLTNFRNHASIVDIDVQDSLIDDRGLESIANLPLRRLSLSGSQVTGSALAACQGSSLRSLDLNETPLNADHLQHLSSMKTLFRLGVRGVALNDQQAEFIRQTPAVMELDLRNTGLTDFGVTRIATPQCPVMELDVVHLSPDLVNSIARREENCTFHVDKQTVEPDLMRRVLQMECEVEFQQCEFTSEAIELIEQQHATAHRLSVKEPLNTPDSVLQRMRRLYLLDN